MQSFKKIKKKSINFQIIDIFFYIINYQLYITFNQNFREILEILFLLMICMYKISL